MMYSSPDYKMQSNIWKEVLGGEPMVIVVKIIVGALTMLWGDVQVIGWGMTAYFILLLFDAIMGAIISGKKGKPFKVGYFVSGPGKKVIFTAMMLFATAIVDRISHLNNVLVFGVVAYISMSGLMDVASKYGELTGSKVLSFIKQKANGILTTKEE